MNQFTTFNQRGEKYYLYKQATMTKSHGEVTLHFFSKNADFNGSLRYNSVQKASEVPDGYFIHEDPFTHRLTCPPEKEREKMLVSVYKTN